MIIRTRRKPQQKYHFQCCAVARIETINNLIPSQKLAAREKTKKQRQRHDERRHPAPLHVKMKGIARTPKENSSTLYTSKSHRRIQ
jgi:hypothetical protein